MNKGYTEIMIDGMDIYGWLRESAKTETNIYYDEISVTTMIHDDGYRKEYKTVRKTNQSITIYLFNMVDDNEPRIYISITKEADCADNILIVVRHEKSDEEDVYEKGIPIYNGDYDIQHIEKILKDWHYTEIELEQDIGEMMI